MTPKLNADINKKRLKRIATAIVFVLTIILLYFIWPNIHYYGTILKMVRSQSTITIGLSLREIEPADIPVLDINAWQMQYLARHKVPFSLISLDYIYIPDSFISNGNSLCIAEIKITSESSLDPSGDVIYLVNEIIDENEVENTEKQEICLVAGKNVIFPDHFQIAPIAYSKYIDPYFYPFDTRTVKYNLSSQLYFKDTGKDLNADTQVLMSVSPPRWIPNTKIATQLVDRDELELKTTFHRFPLFEVLSIILPISMLFIFILLYRIRNEFGSFWEVIVGLILGLWSLSEVLVPSYIDYPTITGTLILFLYIIIGAIVIDSVIRQLSQRDVPIVNSPPPVGEVPDDTSIESLYAWAIDKLNDGIESAKIADALFNKARNVNSATHKKKLIEVGEKFIRS